MNKRKTRKSDTITSIAMIGGFILFVYIMEIINLYKLTGQVQWNIFQSEALPESLVISGVGLSIYMLYLAWKSYRKKKS